MKKINGVNQAAHARAIKEIIIKDEAELDDDLADFVFELSAMRAMDAENKILKGELEKFEEYEAWYGRRAEKIMQIATARHLNGVR